MRQSRLKSLVWTGFLEFFPTGHLLDAPAAPSSPTSLPNFSTAAFLHRRTRATRLPQPKFMNSEEASKESMRLTVILFLPFHGSNWRSMGPGKFVSFLHSTFREAVSSSLGSRRARRGDLIWIERWSTDSKSISEDNCWWIPHLQTHLKRLAPHGLQRGTLTANRARRSLVRLRVSDDENSKFGEFRFSPVSWKRYRISNSKSILLRIFPKIYENIPRLRPS